MGCVFWRVWVVVVCFEWVGWVIVVGLGSDVCWWMGGLGGLGFAW